MRAAAEQAELLDSLAAQGYSGFAIFPGNGSLPRQPRRLRRKSHSFPVYL
jgi:hypothetical protein